jgi:hypothetical protein
LRPGTIRFETFDFLSIIIISHQAGKIYITILTLNNNTGIR